ncbi:MAG: TetR-like C-terminal domain-containing protein [Myxococcota bacterium]
MTQAYVCFGLSHPEHYGVMLDPSVAVEDSEEGLRAIALSAFAPLVEAVVACRPELPGEAARHRARTAWASAHGAVLLGRLGAFSKLGGAEGPEGVAEEAARSMLRNVMV